MNSSDFHADKVKEKYQTNRKKNWVLFSIDSRWLTKFKAQMWLPCQPVLSSQFYASFPSDQDWIGHTQQAFCRWWKGQSLLCTLERCLSSTFQGVGKPISASPPVSPPARIRAHKVTSYLAIFSQGKMVRICCQTALSIASVSISHFSLRLYSLFTYKLLWQLETQRSTNARKSNIYSQRERNSFLRKLKIKTNWRKFRNLQGLFFFEKSTMLNLSEKLSVWNVYNNSFSEQSTIFWRIISILQRPQKICKVPCKMVL